jgi:hypothetical protein
MMLPNLVGLLIMGGTVKKLAFDYIRHTRTGRALEHKAFYFTEAPKAVAKGKAKPKKTKRKTRR